MQIMIYDQLKIVFMKLSGKSALENWKHAVFWSKFKLTFDTTTTTTAAILMWMSVNRGSEYRKFGHISIQLNFCSIP